MDQVIKKILVAFNSKDEALHSLNNNDFDFEFSPEDLIIATKFVEEMVWPDEAEKKAADEAEKKEKKRISNRRQKATRKKKEDDQQAQINIFLKEVMASLSEAIEEESQKQQIDEREEVGSSSMERRKYTREERGKGILVEEVSLPVVDEDAVEEMEVEKLTENDKPPPQEQGAFGIPLLTKSQMRNLKKRGKTQKLRQEIEKAAVENRKHQGEISENHIRNAGSDCVEDCKVAITQMLVSTQLAISNMQEATATHQQSLTLALLQQFAASINNDTATKVACIDAPDSPIT